MNLKNKPLDEWLKTAPANTYNHGKKIDFFSKFNNLKDYLKDHLYKEIASGAMLQEPDLVLNDHGEKHIEKVIEKASELVSFDSCKLSAYEVYVLLMCILLHDAGNIFGRYNHESNLDAILEQTKNLCGEDMVEVNLFKRIIYCHGGKINGSENKDKISSLEENDEFLNGSVRLQVIASILRFADELSDDKRRAYSTLLLTKKLSKKSEIHHAFSYALTSVKLSERHKAVELKFDIDKTFAITPIELEKNEQTYLLDEIFRRIMKMHLERIYCMRFLRGVIDINTISVSIKFYDSHIDLFPNLKFEVRESGYPAGRMEDLFDICDPLIDSSGNRINGNYIKEQLEQTA